MREGFECTARLKDQTGSILWIHLLPTEMITTLCRWNGCRTRVSTGIHHRGNALLKRKRPGTRGIIGHRNRWLLEKIKRHQNSSVSRTAANTRELNTVWVTRDGAPHRGVRKPCMIADPCTRCTFNKCPKCLGETGVRSTVDEMAVKKVCRILENLTQKGCQHRPPTSQRLRLKTNRNGVCESDARVERTHQTATDGGDMAHETKQGSYG